MPTRSPCPCAAAHSTSARPPKGPGPGPITSAIPRPRWLAPVPLLSPREFGRGRRASDLSAQARAHVELRGSPRALTSTSAAPALPRPALDRKPPVPRHEDTPTRAVTRLSGGCSGPTPGHQPSLVGARLARFPVLYYSQSSPAAAIFVQSGVGPAWLGTAACV